MQIEMRTKQQTTRHSLTKELQLFSHLAETNAHTRLKGIMQNLENESNGMI